MSTSEDNDQGVPIAFLTDQLTRGRPLRGPNSEGGSEPIIGPGWQKTIRAIRGEEAVAGGGNDGDIRRGEKI